MPDQLGVGSLRGLAFCAMALIWGFTWLPMKVASEVVPPIFLATARFLLAAVCFFVVASLQRVPLTLKHPARVLAASLLISTGCYSLLFWGVARAPSGLSAIVNLALMPIFIILIGSLYGQERVTARRVRAIGLGIIGLVLLFSGRTGAPADGQEAMLGLVAVAAGTLSYAWGAVVSRPLMEVMHPISLAFWESSLGAIALVPISLLVEGYDASRFSALADGRVVLGLGVLVLGGSLGAFSIYLWLVRDWGAFRAGLYAFVSPIVAVALGVVVADEAFGWPEAVGMAVMFTATGIALTEGRRKSEHAS